MSEPTKPDDATREAERAEADEPARPDRMPTPDEEQAVEDRKVDPQVRKNAEEMAERGAHQEGEGRVP
jgi:hypothetical protein